MTKTQHIDLILRIALEGLQEDEGKHHSGCNGHIDFLLRELASLCLNKRQRQQIAEIVRQQSICLYGRDAVEANEAKIHARTVRMARGDDPTTTIAGDEQPGSTAEREHPTRTL